MTEKNTNAPPRGKRKIPAPIRPKVRRTREEEKQRCSLRRLILWRAFPSHIGSLILHLAPSTSSIYIPNPIWAHTYIHIHTLRHLQPSHSQKIPPWRQQKIFLPSLYIFILHACFFFFFFLSILHSNVRAL